MIDMTRATKAPATTTKKVAPKKARPAKAAPAPAPTTTAHPWTFLTNHALVILSVAEAPDARVRDIAERVGITERAVQRILAELEEAGYLERDKNGRRNSYEVNANMPLRHPIKSHRTIRELLNLVRAGA